MGCKSGVQPNTFETRLQHQSAALREALRILPRPLRCSFLRNSLRLSARFNSIESDWIHSSDRLETSKRERKRDPPSLEANPFRMPADSQWLSRHLTIPFSSGASQKFAGHQQDRMAAKKAEPAREAVSMAFGELHLSRKPDNCHCCSCCCCWLAGCS